MTVFFRIPTTILCFLLLTGLTANAQWDTGAAPDDEEVFFMDIPVVTIASKKEQEVLDVPAAVYVLSQEDIRRSGVTTIPEALRMVPGINVAQVTSNKWAISSRGFNGAYSKKLLVLMDGRSIYSPFFGGVYWDVQETLLEDIEKIEVVRGPGGTLWGSNAVNGVINIVTKHARDTIGGLVTAGTGNLEEGFAGARYGGKVSEATYFRLYAKHSEKDEFVTPEGRGQEDDWNMTKGGFRIDTELTSEDSLTFQGDIYEGETGEPLTVPVEEIWSNRPILDTADLSGGNILARWEHVFSPDSEFQVQIYYDRIERLTSVCSEERDTFDFDFQHRFTLGDLQEIVWGLGYRYTTDDTADTFVVSFEPDTRGVDIWSAFIQDEFSFMEDRLRFTVGSKFEDNDYSGFEIQPSARVLFKPVDNHSVWVSVSRAVRIPSRSHADIRMNIAALQQGERRLLLTAFGNDDFDSEKVVAYEAGWRSELSEKLQVDLALFYNEYDDLFTMEDGSPFFEDGHIVLVRNFDNKMEGETYGGELSLRWQALDNWNLAAGLSLLRMNLEVSGNELHRPAKVEGRSPEEQFFIRSMLDLPYNLAFDTSLYYFSSLGYYVSEHDNLDVPAFARVDLRLGWQPLPSLILEAVGQNILDDQHPEFQAGEAGINPTEVPRSFYGKVTWKF